MKPTVAVLYGGRSAEHEISVRSARSVLEAINRDKYDVCEILITPEGKWKPGPILPEPGANAGIDMVFPVLHGTFGEDGTIQGLLELAGLPYVGSGVLASSVAMDKEVAKRLCRERGLPVVDYVTVRRGRELDEKTVREQLSYPVFVKPANLGSSLGISKAADFKQLAAALSLAAEYDRKVLVERAIEGRELECSVIGNDQPLAAQPCEILPSREFYDYEDKYVLNRSRHRLPAELSGEKIAEVRGMAVAAYQAVECEGMARVDFLLESGTDRLYINEVNTIPGFTSISMFPKMWEQAGVSCPELVDRLIELAFERHRGRAATRYTR